jgi:hypothetical protein
MFKKLYELGKAQLFSPLGIVIMSALLLLDEVMRQGYFFRPSDVFALRFTHEKFLVGLFMIGFVSQYRRIRKSKGKTP